MLVGATLSGKTQCWKVLHEALNILNKENKDVEKYPPIKYEIINPKSISIDELFGYFDDVQPPTWHDGILSTVLKKMCTDTKKDDKWLILDGPVDTLWIESMNSVLDDNKLLTLNNGDRIALSPYVRLLFEIENLAVASPATVSRAGMIYIDIDEIGWKPFIEMWVASKEDNHLRENLNELIDKYLEKTLKIKRTRCKELVVSSEFACIQAMTRFFDNQIQQFGRVQEEDEEAYRLLVEKIFVFCLIWSVGATVTEATRGRIDDILRDIESIFPHQNTVYEHYINAEKRDWAPWEEKLQTPWRPQEKDLEFHQITVPTIDTVRNNYVARALLKHGSQVLIAGHTGVGKTALVESILSTLEEAIYTNFTVNFSAQTTSTSTQEIIESNFDKWTKNKFTPKNAKKVAICFVDDLNMPRKDTFGSQPPLELIRQWIDYMSWYDREKLTLKYFYGLQFLCAMGEPGGGRAVISTRLLSKFHVINFAIPSDSQIKRIYEAISSYKFTNFEEDIKTLTEPLAVATINLFTIITENFLPTPEKSHYVFNMRDISKVFQGIFRADKSFYESKEQIAKLWAHEVLRIFHDRLISIEDRDQLKQYLND